MCCWRLSEQRLRNSDERILDLHVRHKAEYLGTERRSLKPLLSVSEFLFSSINRKFSLEDDVCGIGFSMDSSMESVLSV